ncbi:hypothetical protein [Streptomyces noursei]
MIAAVTELASRAGAETVEIGHCGGTEIGRAGWYAFTRHCGALLAEHGHPTPTAACHALGIQLVKGRNCWCGLRIALHPSWCGSEGGRVPGTSEWWVPTRDAGWCVWERRDRQWLASCKGHSVGRAGHA